MCQQTEQRDATARGVRPRRAPSTEPRRNFCTYALYFIHYCYCTPPHSALSRQSEIIETLLYASNKIK